MSKRLFLFFIFSSLCSLQAEHNYALIMGNSDYPTTQYTHIPAQLKPLQKILKNLNYPNDVYQNLKSKALFNTIRNFLEYINKSKNDGFFYFSGQLIEQKGRHYLMPIDTNVNKTNIDILGFELESLLLHIEESKNSANVIILDVSIKTDREEKERNEAVIHVPKNCFLIIANTPGLNFTSDGLMTQALIQKIPKQQPLEESLFGIYATLTQNQQQLWWQNNLGQEYQLLHHSRVKKANEEIHSKQYQIQILLEKAKIAYKNKKLMTPKKESAFTMYQAVLALDENNAAALKGKQRIVKRYIGWAKQKKQLEQLKLAKRFIKRALSILPEHTGALKIQRALQHPNLSSFAEPTPIINTAGRTFHDLIPGGLLAPEIVIIPAGHFSMGDLVGTGKKNETPIHTINIEAFAISRFEITIKDYNYYLRNIGQPTPSIDSNHPITNVTWHQAQAYTQWLSLKTNYHYRLPTEAEWEYSARSKTETSYWWGATLIQEKANIKTAQQKIVVGQYENNDFKLFDTVGNVAEWTASLYTEQYNGEELKAGTYQAGNFLMQLFKNEYRVTRGGSFFSPTSETRVSARIKRNANNAYRDTGFRVVRDLAMSTK